MDPFPIQTIGGLETLAILFNAIAAIFQGSLIKAFTVLATSIGAVSAIIYTIWQNQLKPLTSWFISYQVLALFLLAPVAEVYITDTMTGRFRTIDNVPFALAVTASTLSTLSVSATQALEQVLQPLPPLEPGAGGQGGYEFVQLSYSRTGFMFGAQAMIQMKGVQITNNDIADNMKEFVNQCVVYPALNGNRYTLEDLQKSGDIWGLVSEAPSKLLGFAWRNVERNEQGRFMHSPGTEIITCAEGVLRFNHLWALASEHALTDLYKKIGEMFGVKPQGSHDALSICAASNFPGALNKLTGQAQSASDRIRQQMMIRAVLKGNQSKVLELGGTTDFEATRAYLQQRQTYKTIGETVSQTLLSLKNVLEALAYALFIFVMMVALLPQGWKIFLFWVKIIAWIQLWPPLFAILNFLVTEYMASSMSHQIGNANGISIWNLVGVCNLAADMAATAGYISSLIPVMAWALLDKGGYAFVSVASQLLGVSQGAATTAALEKTTGNYSFGNVTMDGLQADNTNLFKQDTSASYSGGHFATQDGVSSRLFAASGEQIINRSVSQLPVTIHGSEAQEQVYRNLYTEAESLQQSESQQATQSQQMMTSDYLQIGKHASNMIASNHQWSNHETTSAMQEAGHAYNQSKKIATDFGISEELVNQKLAEASAGLSVSISPTEIGPFHVGGAVGGNLTKQESSSARAVQAENAIKELGQSEDFRKSVQHGYQSFNARNFDVNDQNVKESVQNYSGNYEKTVSHQKNASKAYETSQALQNEMGFNRTNSLGIDSNYSQDFVNQVGADRIEHMSTQEMQKEANAFISQKTHSLENNIRSKHNLKSQYQQKELPDSFESPEAVRNQTFATIHQKSEQEKVSVDRHINNTEEVQARQSMAINLSQVWRAARLGGTYIAKETDFKDKVERHVVHEMGFLQSSATQEMFDNFNKDQAKPIEPQEYTAVNLEPKEKQR